MSCFNLPTDTKGRKLLNISVKKKIIELAESGVKQKDIAVMFGLGRSTVTKILLNKDNVLKAAYEDINNSKYRIRRDKLYPLEIKIFKWSVETCPSTSQSDEDPFIFANHKSISNKFKENINKEDIFRKANEISLEMGLQNFIPTDSWLNKLKRKFNIRFRRCTKTRLNNEAARNNIKDNVINTIICKPDLLGCSTFSSDNNYIVKSNVSDDYYPINNHLNNVVTPNYFNNIDNTILYRDSNLNFNSIQFNHLNLNFLPLNQNTISEPFCLNFGSNYTYCPMYLQYFDTAPFTSTRDQSYQNNYFITEPFLFDYSS